MTDLQGGYRIIDIEDGDIFTTLKDAFENETKPLLVKGVNGTTDHFATVSDLKIITDDNGEISEIDVPLGELSYNSSTGKHTQYIARVTPSSFTTEEVEVASGGGTTELTYTQIAEACRPKNIISDEVVIINAIENIINNFNDWFSVSVGNESKIVQVKDTDGNNMLNEDPTSLYGSKFTYYYMSILRDLNFFTFTDSPCYLRQKYLDKEITLLIYLALGIAGSQYNITYKFDTINTFSKYTFYDSETNPFEVTTKTYSINDLISKDEDGTDTEHIYLPSNFDVCDWIFITEIAGSSMQYDHFVDWKYIRPNEPKFTCMINTNVASLDDTFLTFTKVS